MANSPELWAFVLANTGIFIMSSVLTALSYLAYRQSDGQSSYLTSAFGFGFVVLGGLIEPVYQLGVRSNGTYGLNTTELLWLQAGEGTLIAIGLGLLFYAITHFSSGRRSTDEVRPAVTDGSTNQFDSQQADD